MDTKHTHVTIAAILGLIAVALGAFGAHGLKELLAERDTSATWETAVRYQMWHALAILLCSHNGNRFNATKAATCFSSGTVLFSGSLYILALGGPKWLGPVTPLGGLLLIIGWGLLAASSLKLPKAP